MIGGLARALAAALLFGAAIPASRPLVERLGALELAGLLYLGAAIGVLPWALRASGMPLGRTNGLRLGGAVLFGGVIGPVLLLLALERAPAATVSLGSSLEGTLTAVLGALFFREALGRMGWASVALAAGAGVLLSGAGGRADVIPMLLVGGACLAWALDNHWTALLDGLTPARSTFVKGVVAGGTNLLLAFAVGAPAPAPADLAVALAIGALGYGASITLYIGAAQEIGATRAQTVFASAPFLGAALAVPLLGESLAPGQLAAGALLALAVVLLLRSQHEHAHVHEPVEHVHAHTHDDGHHDHAHPGLPPGTRHSHAHRHVRVEHAHRHVSDLHHRHGHDTEG